MKKFKSKIMIIIVGLFILAIFSIYSYGKLKSNLGFFYYPSISFFIVLYFSLHLRNKEESNLKIKNIFLEYLFKFTFLINGIFLGMAGLFAGFSLFQTKSFTLLIFILPLLYYAHILMWLPSDYNEIIKKSKESDISTQ